MVEPVVISAYSACNGLGRTTKEVVQKLARSEHGLSRCPIDVPFETVTGTVPGNHPPPPSKYSAHDSRVLRLALMAYEEIATKVDAARQRYGDKRIGAVLAT